MEEFSTGGRPEHRLLVERSRRAAQRDSAQGAAERWRQVPDARKGEIIAQLMNMAYLIERNRPDRSARTPLKFPRFSTTRDIRA